MKRTRLILVALIALSIPLSCRFLSEKKATSFKVTYHVSVLSIGCRHLSITYIDSTGLVHDVCLERSWSRTVSLPAGAIASLYVSDTFDPRTACTDNIQEEMIPNVPIYFFEAFSLWIEHEKGIKMNTGRVHESLVNVSLSAP